MKKLISRLVDKINHKSDKKKEQVRKENLELPGIYVQYTVILTSLCNSIPIMRYAFIPENVFNKCEDYDEAYNEVDNYLKQYVVPWMYVHTLEHFKDQYLRYISGERWYENH